MAEEEKLNLKMYVSYWDENPFDPLAGPDQEPQTEIRRMCLTPEYNFEAFKAKIKEFLDAGENPLRMQWIGMSS